MPFAADQIDLSGFAPIPLSRPAHELHEPSGDVSGSPVEAAMPLDDSDHGIVAIIDDAPRTPRRSGLTYRQENAKVAREVKIKRQLSHTNKALKDEKADLKSTLSAVSTLLPGAAQLIGSAKTTHICRKKKKTCSLPLSSL